MSNVAVIIFVVFAFFLSTGFHTMIHLGIIAYFKLKRSRSIVMYDMTFEDNTLRIKDVTPLYQSNGDFKFPVENRDGKVMVYMDKMIVGKGKALELDVQNHITIRGKDALTTIVLNNVKMLKGFFINRCNQLSYELHKMSIEKQNLQHKYMVLSNKVDAKISEGIENQIRFHAKLNPFTKYDNAKKKSGGSYNE